MLSHLNAPQREAVKYLDGPLLVLAGAGSGKTRVITQKITYLIEECGYAPNHIAAITFTNKAAREMQERVNKLMQGKPAKGLTVCTFHALGVQIMRQEAHRLAYKPQFSILDSADAMQIVNEILKSTDKQEIRRVQWRISAWKNALVSPDVAISTAETDIDATYAKIYQRYQDTLKAYQALDFDDLIRLPAELFASDAEMLEKWRKKLRYLLIDEYQDTNACQYQIVKQLCGISGAFTAVGDDDQAIYGWRGAAVKNLHQLHDDYPRLKVIQLTQNYRSTIRILRAANSVIANNTRLYDKQLWSEHGNGDPLQILAAKDENEEAPNVVMRLLTNCDDDPAFIRAATTPKRGIGPTTLEKLGEYAGQRKISLFEAAFEAGFETRVSERQLEPLLTFCQYINALEARVRNTPVSEIMADLLKAIDYEVYIFDNDETRAAQTKWNNVQEFVGWLGKKGEADDKNLIELTQTIALITLLENRSEDEIDAVRLSTIHAAKGLEFGHVFLVGAEEDILPHRESVENGTLEEERRLMYVAITRAQRSLTISYCKRRKRAGELQSCEPSRFIAEISNEDIRLSGQDADPVEQREQGNARLANIKAMLAQK